MNIISITPIPSQVEKAYFGTELNKCEDNSRNVCLEFPEAKIVEGILLIKDNEGHGTAMAHMWNSLNGKHFDITAPLWNGRAEDIEIYDKVYLSVSQYAFSGLPTQTPEFSKKTLKEVEHMNDVITWTSREK